MIPAWNHQGVIPPIRPGAQGHDVDRSPYQVSLHTFVNSMGSSPARLNIISGLLAFRAEIHRLGINTGFQWLNGSFSENVERTEERDPRDVDVVTFFQLPAGEDQASLYEKNPQLFEHDVIKEKYQVDSYWMPLGEQTDASSVQLISYWYSMWSHRRDGIWKGFVQVDLDQTQDPIAVEALAQAKNNFGVA